MNLSDVEGEKLNQIHPHFDLTLNTDTDIWSIKKIPLQIAVIHWIPIKSDTSYSYTHSSHLQSVQHLQDMGDVAS